MESLEVQRGRRSDWSAVAGVLATFGVGVVSACIVFWLLVGGSVFWVVPVVPLAVWLAVSAATAVAMLLVWAVSRSALAACLLAAGPVSMALVIGSRTVGMWFLLGVWLTLMLCSMFVALLVAALRGRDVSKARRAALVYAAVFVCLVAAESLVVWAAGVKTGEGAPATLSRGQLAAAVVERDMQRRWEVQERLALHHPELLAELAVSKDERVRSSAVEAIVLFRCQPAIDRLRGWAAEQQSEHQGAAESALEAIEAKRRKFNSGE